MVVIGSSAGGIEALSTLVASLTNPFPAPIVIAQHLDPRHPSHLQEILARRTTLPLQVVNEPTKLQPGVIYLIPSARHAEITGDEVTVRPTGAGGPKPSVDLLLKSAAKMYGEGCVAVILTGSGSDGTAGAAAVKEAGGTVVIQNPATASFPSMPRSLAPTSVDVVVEIGEMGERLLQIVSTSPLPRDEDDDVALLLDGLRSTNGIDFSSYKRPTILRRLRGRMNATRQPTVSQYARHIAADPIEHQRLVSSFLIKVTSFLRDPKVMTYLRDTVLPDLIATARGSRELRLWSAGCATGEEAYSLAILVADVLGDDLGKFEVRIFATDVDEEALAFARHGVYARSALNNLSAAQRKKYFRELDGEFEVAKPIRGMVVFGQHDLGMRAPFPRMDLVLCRNVLIYFTKELQERALSVFAYSLRAGGRLILGSSETVGRLSEAFSVESQPLRIYQSHGDSHFMDAGLALVRRPSPPSTAAVLDRTVAATRIERERRRTSAGLTERLINELPIGVAVVDGRYMTLRINSAARALLAIPGPALGQDLIHLTETLPATELRTAIRSALGGRTTDEVHRVSSPDTSADEARYLRLTVAPHRASEEGEIEGALLLVTDVTATETDRRALAGMSAKLDASIGQRQRLAEANREIAAANDLLRVENEDLLFNAEEAQASREEMETLAEELQATNEELETLNEELQATNEELETANEDLNAQTEELAGQRTDLATGRDRLAAVIDGMADALLVVDRDGEMVISNEAYRRMFAGMSDSAVLEDEVGKPIPPARWPQERAREGEDFRMEFTVRDPDSEGRSTPRRWFEATGQPVGFADERWADIVVIRDITDHSVRRLEEQFMAAASHELRSPIAALHGNVQLLVRRLDGAAGDDKIRGYAASALAQTRVLGALVDRLFDMSAVAAGRFELERSVIDLGALARRVVEVARVLGPDQQVTVHAPRARVFIDADAGRIEQVLLGLLTNSIVHGDAVCVDVRIGRAGGRAVLTVADDGRGISRADQRKLFDRLQRVGAGHGGHQRGLGLGLFLARQIVGAHDGTIDLASIKGQGTTVTVRMPRVDKEPRS